MKRYKFVAVMAILALLLAACQASTPQPQPEPTQPPLQETPTTPAPTLDVTALYDVTWALVSYGNPANPTVVPPNISITAVFDAEGNISGSAGCNRYMSGFRAAPDGSMTIEPEIVTTMMACEQAQMEAESAFLGALAAVKSFTFSADDNLSLIYALDATTDGLLVFKKGAVPLTNTTWVLISYGDPQNPTLAQQATPVTAYFSEGETPNQGNVSGSASCNNYNASYTLDGEQMTIGVLASTFMLCDQGMEQETAYLAALAAAERYEISGQKLAIVYDGGKGVLTYSSASLPFTKTLWRLSSIDGVPVPADIEISALFSPGAEAGQGQVSGIAACNNYMASYTEDTETIPPSLTIGDAATTMMLCDDALMQAEQNYLLQLKGAQSYTILGGTLQIATQSGSTLTYVAERTPLSGALWQLVSLGDVENPVAPVQGANFTAQFTRNPGATTGVLSGTTGCNQYAAAFTASVTEMKINQPGGSQNRTCAPGLTEQENLYYLALNDVTTYSIQGSQLVMPYDNGQQALVFQAGQLVTAPLQPLSSLDGTLWFLWSLNDQSPVAGSTVSASFTIKPDNSGGQISGNAGCNTYIADFGLDLGIQTTLTSGQNCANPPGVMDFEKNYMNALANAYGFWLTGDQLMINSGAGVLTYRLTQPPAANDQAYLLTGRNWFLISFNANYSTAGTQEPFTRFNPDGSLNGFTGCNNFNGQWSSSPATPVNQIRISDLSSTKAACTSTALSAQEQAMLAVLGSAQTFRVTGNNLQIVGGSGNLNYSLNPLNRPEEVAPPNAVISAPSQAQVNQTVTFDGSKSTSGVPLVRWRWDFGDGGRGSGAVVQHVYRNPGSYRVQMTVDDQLGRMSSTAWTIQINAQPAPTAAPTAIPTQSPPPTEAPTQAPPPTAAPTGAPTEAPPPTQAPTEAPTEAPPPTVEPTPPPSVPPTAAIQGPPSGFVGEPVGFSASGSTAGSSPIQTFAWDFGDGQRASGGSDATHLYNQGGTFQVTVVVTDVNGQSSSATTQIVINARLDTTVWAIPANSRSSAVSPTPGSAITLQFLNGQLSGFAGCNSYNGSYTAVDNGDGTFSISGTNITTSRQTCPQDVMQVETEFLAALQQVTLAQVQGNILNLTYPAGALVFEELYTPR